MLTFYRVRCMVQKGQNRDADAFKEVRFVRWAVIKMPVYSCVILRFYVVEMLLEPC